MFSFLLFPCCDFHGPSVRLPAKSLPIVLCVCKPVRACVLSGASTPSGATSRRGEKQAAAGSARHAATSRVGRRRPCATQSRGERVHGTSSCRCSRPSQTPLPLRAHGTTSSLSPTHTVHAVEESRERHPNAGRQAGRPPLGRFSIKPPRLAQIPRSPRHARAPPRPSVPPTAGGASSPRAALPRHRTAASLVRRHPTRRGQPW